MVLMFVTRMSRPYHQNHGAFECRNRQKTEAQPSTSNGPAEDPCGWHAHHLKPCIPRCFHVTNAHLQESKVVFGAQEFLGSHFIPLHSTSFHLTPPPGCSAREWTPLRAPPSAWQPAAWRTPPLPPCAARAARVRSRAAWDPYIATAPSAAGRLRRWAKWQRWARLSLEFEAIS